MKQIECDVDELEAVVRGMNDETVIFVRGVVDEIPERVHTALQKARVPVTLDFSRCSLFSVLNDGALEFCRCLKRIVFPEGLVEIGRAAVQNCENLEEVVIPSTLRRMGTCAFHDDYKLKRMILPENLAEIPEDCFYGCSSLSEIRIPASVRKIGDAAFQRTGLVSVEIPHLVEEIPFYCFQQCDALEEVILHAGIRRVCQGAFWLCGSLGRVKNLPEAAEIGDLAFEECGKLEFV